jgi:hypothetical protein
LQAREQARTQLRRASDDVANAVAHSGRAAGAGWEDHAEIEVAMHW